MEEVRLLLEFVQISFEGGSRTDGMDIRIVANVRDSLLEVRRNIEEKARVEAYKGSLEHAVIAAPEGRLASPPALPQQPAADFAVRAARRTPPERCVQAILLANRDIVA
jgi:hypothetical protein